MADDVVHTLNEDEIIRCFNEGDFFLGLGIMPDTEPIMIDRAGARLGTEFPSLAGTIGHVREVLIYPVQKEVYEIACAFRDDVIKALYQKLGLEFADAAPNLRERSWIRCQELLHCDFRVADVKIGPNGAESMRQLGLGWAVELVQYDCISACKLDLSSPRVSVTISQSSCPKCNNRRWVQCRECNGTGKKATQDPGGENTSDPLMMIDEPMLIQYPALEETSPVDCPQCRGSGWLACDCQDNYLFDMGPDLQPGQVLKGYGTRTGKAGYLILDRAVFSKRPEMQLMMFYGFNQLGLDITLEQAQANMSMGTVFIEGLWFCVTWLLSNAVGNLQLGLIVGIAGVLMLTMLFRYQERQLQKGLRSSPYVVVSIYLIVPFVGVLAGLAFGSLSSGLLISGIPAILFGASGILLNRSRGVYQEWMKGSLRQDTEE